MEQSTEFLSRERTSKRHSEAGTPERSARRSSLDSHMKRRKESRTFSKGDTDSGSQAELIRTPYLHKHLRVQLSSCFWQSAECCQKRQCSPPAPALPSLLAGDTSRVLWVTSALQQDQTLSPGWPSCQTGALRTQKHRAAGAGTKGERVAAAWSRGMEGSSVLGWWQPGMKMRHQTKTVPALYMNELFHSCLQHSLSYHKDSLDQTSFSAKSVLHFGRWHTQAARTGITPCSCASLWWNQELSKHEGI